MKCHIGVDADSGLVHTVVGTAANVKDVTQASALAQGEEMDVFADAGYQGAAKREEVQGIPVNHPICGWGTSDIFSHHDRYVVSYLTGPNQYEPIHIASEISIRNDSRARGVAGSYAGGAISH